MESLISFPNRAALFYGAVCYVVQGVSQLFPSDLLSMWVKSLIVTPFTNGAIEQHFQVLLLNMLLKVV